MFNKGTRKIRPSAMQPAVLKSRPARGVPGSTAPRKKIYKRGSCSGTHARREIRKYQRGVEMIIPKAPFSRLVREITVDLDIVQQYRFQRSALEALQEAAEAFICHMFESTNLVAMHAKRVTLQKKDLDLWLRLTEPFGRTFTPCFKPVQMVELQ